MTTLKAKSELKKIAQQVNELTKIYKASNLTDKKIQGMLTNSLLRRNYLKSIIE